MMTPPSSSSESPAFAKANNEPPCGVYFAPSTIPGAGFGLFAGKNFAEGQEVTPGDLVVPYMDMPWHNGVEEDDYLGFLWNEYSWDTSGFQWMDQEGFHISAASFGIGAAPNCWLPLVNVADTTTDYDTAGLHRRRDPGAGAITPYHNRRGYATTDIPAGMELFVDYGYSYFETRPAHYGPVPHEDDYDRGDVLMKSLYNLTQNTDWSSTSSTEGQGSCPAGQVCEESKATNGSKWEYQQSLYDLVLSLKETFFSPVLATLPQDLSVIEFVADHGTRFSEYQRSIRTPEWLQEHGTCMDNLRPGRSKIPQAGRGAFAHRSIAKGEVVAPIPLIHADRNLFDMYEPIAQSHPDKADHLADPERPVHKQLLLNYCFGHRDTQLLLCPYGVDTALVNHSQEKANAKIVWSNKSIRRPEWLHQHPSEWIFEMTAGLAFDLVATRDIERGEEVLIDYGDEWQEAWNRHLRGWKQPPGAHKYVEAYVLDSYERLKTIDEGSYSSANKDIFCRDEFRIFAGLEKAEFHLHTCRIVDRRRDGETGEYFYTAEIIERIEYVDVDGEPNTCQEELREVLFNVSRDCFFIEDVYYSRDHAQYWSFRHDLRIPDEIFPEEWIDSLHEPDNHQPDEWN